MLQANLFNNTITHSETPQLTPTSTKPEKPNIYNLQYDQETRQEVLNIINHPIITALNKAFSQKDLEAFWQALINLELELSRALGQPGDLIQAKQIRETIQYNLHRYKGEYLPEISAFLQGEIKSYPFTLQSSNLNRLILTQANNSSSPDRKNLSIICKNYSHPSIIQQAGHLGIKVQ